MGYLNGSTLVMPSHNNASTVTTTSLDVTATDNGFSVTPGTTVPKVTLTAYQNGQYYISYNGRYLARSSYGSSLTWGTSTSQYGRWHIDANGIYVASSGGYGGNSTYYLYYNNGSFQLSTTQQNNIHFYVEGDCPSAVTYTITATANPTEGGTVTGAGTYDHDASCTLTATANEGYVFVNWTENGEEVASDTTFSFTVTSDRELVANFEAVVTTVTQTITFTQGWNWWSTDLDIDINQLKSALGTNASSITSHNGTYSYIQGVGWVGNFPLDQAQMYKIYMNTACEATLSGSPVNPADYPITIGHGTNWIGYPLSQSMSVNDALAGLEAEEGDFIKWNKKMSMYSNGTWSGNLQSLEPGKGYIYKSNASTTKQFTFPQ